MRRVVLAFSLLLIFINPLQRANAQSTATELLEPVRLALVIGVGDYTYLNTLTGPCHDVTAVTEAINSLGSFTSVESECDLTNDRLRTKFSEFSEKLRSTPRAFGFIYFSGHGAWIDGVNYIFGKDSNIDFDLEASEYINFKKNDANRSEIPHLFGPQTVELDYTFKRLNNIVGKGLVVFIDACRDNMIYDQLLEKNVSNMTFPRGISTRPRGYMFSFATEEGKKAPDAAKPREAGLFAQVLAAEIRKQKDEGVDNYKAIDTFLTAVTSEMSRRSRGGQVPDRAGYLNVPPIFCLHGCKSPRIQWPAETPMGTSVSKSEMLTSAPALFSFLGGHAPTLPHKSRAPLAASPAARLTRTAALRQQADTPPAATDETAPLALEKSNFLPSATQGAQPGRILFEIFWCSGDRRQDSRKTKAEDIQRKIFLMKQQGMTFHNVGVDDALVTEFPPEANFRPGYQRTYTAILYDSERNSEVDWGRTIRGAYPGARMIPTAHTRTPEYMSIYVCDGIDLSSRPALTYVHIADESDRKAAARLQEKIDSAIEKLNFQGIQKIDGYAGMDEVRYFFPAQQGKAVAIAKLLAGELRREVKAKRVFGYDQKLGSKPVIEIWYSTTAFRRSDHVVNKPDSEISRLASR